MKKNLVVSHDPASPAFCRLITNPDAPPFAGRETVSDEALLRLHQYTTFVLDGVGGVPHCPFVGQTERENGYSVRAYREPTDEIDLQGVLADIEAEFHRLSPLPTSQFHGLDTTIIMAAFSHPTANTPAFCRRLAGVYERARHRILRKGLLIGYMSPAHPPDERGESLFKSPIAILTVDRLNRTHIGFMRNDDERAIHAGHFGDIPQKPRPTAAKCPFDHDNKRRD